LRISALILGGILVIYPSAGIVSDTWFPNDERMERTLCRFLLCDDSVVVRSGRQELGSQDSDGPHGAIDAFRMALQRDPHSPSRWADLAEAFLEADRKPEARFCYDQVAAAAPYRPTFLLRVASFHFQMGETRNALAITAGILKSVSAYDSVIFGEYTRLVDDFDDVLRYGMPDDQRAARAFLRYLMQGGRLDDAQKTWEWTASHGFANDALAGECAQFLIDRRRPEAAAAACRQFLGTRAGDYLQSEYL
jgi:tetratricopeptide (TPR) repeat protein